MRALPIILILIFSSFSFGQETAHFGKVRIFPLPDSLQLIQNTKIFSDSIGTRYMLVILKANPNGTLSSPNGETVLFIRNDWLTGAELQFIMSQINTWRLKKEIIRE